MDVRQPIASQYMAALEMLKGAIAACPHALWQRANDITPFWQVAYHALFYTNLYLNDSEQTITLWPGHREEYRSEKPHNGPAPEPASKDTILEFLAHCQNFVRQQVPALTLDAPSGFAWLSLTKFELQIYSIRHIQQHAGELMERLGADASGVDWVGTYRAE